LFLINDFFNDTEMGKPKYSDKYLCLRQFSQVPNKEAGK